MSNLLVLTTGSDLTLFKKSCERVMITPTIYDAKWTGYVDVKLKKALEFLSARSIPEPFLMWVDGNDSLVLNTESEILARLNAMGNPMVISAEKNCWPDPEKSASYPPAPHPRFLNAGGFIGPTNTVMAAMHSAVSHATSQDDQRAWTSAFLCKALPFTVIDHSRSIFASIADGNESLNSRACVKHWNGRTAGREEYFAKIMEAA